MTQPRHGSDESIAGSADDAGAAATLDADNANAVRTMVANLSDEDVVRIYEMTGGAGLVADLAATQMEKRNLDY
ncbi:MULTISPECIES: hypothetical protein [Sphingomonadaceae]|jgi:hypothetical protein|uniref:Uncharacterized protein n=1 Tax=Novosphingobium clariflavum TaxID=2029884 RepID=A0ABV6S423_9SPHN|nr:MULTISPECIES: hypothetical protein [Sphingomonadaceae]MDG2514770.1 hypothetical protein [Sphingobium yanoikuyae]